MKDTNQADLPLPRHIPRLPTLVGRWLLITDTAWLRPDPVSYLDCDVDVRSSVRFRHPPMQHVRHANPQFLLTSP